jgi:hypothetical protein
MRFLLDANLPRSTAPMLARHGHEAIHVAEVGLGPDDAVAAQIVRGLEAFVTQPELLARLPGRLAIVESWRVRFRPA